jgi:hypothetical protein
VTEDLRFPIGRFVFPAGAATDAERRERIDAIDRAPAALKRAIENLNDAQLSTPYRPGGWTVRQVVHHVPDSHLNAYIRIKLALTEDRPTIKPYDEARWADLPDSQTVPVGVSIELLTALHRRWVALLRGMRTEDFALTFVHPEYDHPLTIDEAVALYAWHGQHHVAHIAALRDREGWQ